MLDPYSKLNETDKRQNVYMTVSRDVTDPTGTDVFVRLVNKDTQELLGETKLSLGDTDKVLNGQIENVTINSGLNGKPITLNLTATYQVMSVGGKDVDRLEFWFGSADSQDLRINAVWQSNSLVQGGLPVHKLWSYVPSKPTQTTYYRVQGTEELIATYTLHGYEGDIFTSSTPRVVTNYEFVSGEQESGAIAAPYQVGAQDITTAPPYLGYVGRRVKTIVSVRGDIKIEIQEKPEGAPDSEFVTKYTTGTMGPNTYWDVDPSDPGYITLPNRYFLSGNRWMLYNNNLEANVDTTYYYVQKGSVEVFYVDENGNPLQDSKVAVAHGDTGSGYDTTTLRDAKIVKDGVTYYYKNIDGVGDAGVFAATTHADDERAVEEITAETGTVASNTIKELTYVYVPAGHVNINYVNEAGDVIKAKVVDTVDGEPGTTYDATQDGEQPNTIVAEDGKTYTFKEVSATSAATTGEIEAGVTKEVTYVYKEVKGNVIVNYVDENGNPISGITDAGKETASTVEDTPESSTGTEYTTTDLRPNTITTADGKIYKLVPSANPANETGKVVEGTTEVTYVYELVQGDVVVHYVDTEGNTIADDVTDQVITDTGTDYDTTDNKPNKIVNDETGDVYYILPTNEVKAGDKETGKVVEGTTEVTYIYQKAGNIVVNYTLADGTPIKDPVNDETNQKPGTEYNTTDNKPETITTTDGKVYKLVPAATIGNETGDVEAGKTIEVTYIYEEVKSDVVVEYYNTAGEVIAKTVVDEDDKSVGTVYNTDEDNRPDTITTDAGVVYYYKEVKNTSAPTTGKVAETTTTVQYVYEQAGDVIVHYIATDGTPISGVTNTGAVTASTVDDTVNGKPGSTYDTSDLRPTTIITDEGKTYELVPTATIGNETGNVVSGQTTEVTYVYKEVKGSVVVNYITTDGTVIQDPVTDTPETSTGTDYDTKDHKPTVITTKDGKSYRLVPALTQGSETGEVVPGVTNITYVYEEIKGDVVVNYVNTDGKVIASQVVDTKLTSTGTDYNTADNKPEKIVEDATGDVYYIMPTGSEIQADSAAETGKVVEGTTEVTYVYQKAGNVKVNYTLADGTVIKDPVFDETNQKPGYGYNTTDNKPETITTTDGKVYRLVPTETLGNETGDVESGKTIEVTYIYEEVKSDVVVEYYDTAGNTIAKTVTDTDDASVGTVYNTDEDNRPNTITTDAGVVYYYKEVKDTSAPTTGKVAETTTTVQYVYEQAGNVVVNYVTTDGIVIKTPVKDEVNAKPGSPYDTTDNKPNTITTEDGKVYRLVPNKTTGEENGTVTSGEDKQITYVYEEVTSDVVVEYYNTDGDIIATTVVDEDDASVGKAYNTDEDNRPDTITATDGTVYYYKQVKDTSASTTGQVAETTTTVQYVYEKAGSVTVNYVTTNGIVIKTPVKDEENAKPGSPYDTTDNKPNTITTEDGKTYRLVPNKTTGEENGTITSGQDKQVTYVYEEVKGDVVVEYYDTKGNLISGLSETGVAIDSTEVDTPLSSTGIAYNTDEDNRPSTITTADGKVYYYKAVKDTSAATTGQVVEGTTTVQYVYEQAGNIVVNYVTTDGIVIKTPVNDETNVPAGKSYDTTDNKPNTITTADGTVYELIPSATIGNENGSVESGQTTQVTYVYRKVVTPNNKTVTNHVDENGNPIAPQEEGSTPNKSIPGYEFTGKTITDKDGNVTHIYRKVVTPNHKTVTNHVDENGNPIAPQEEGSTPNKSIPGYEFTGKTITDKDGNVTHIYRKVTGTVTPKVPGEQGGKVTQTGHQAEELPNTGEEHSVISALGLAMVAAAFGMSAKRRRDEE